MKRSFLASAIVLALEASAATSAEAAVLYSNYLSYRTADDPYHPASIDSDPDTNFGASASVSSSTTVPLVLDFAGAGPAAGSSFSFSGAASAAPGVLKARAGVGFRDYGVGSYYLVDMPAGEPDYFPQSGNALASITDQTVISGAAATYDVRFSYAMTGLTNRPSEPGSPYDSWFRPLVAVGSSFHGAGSSYTATIAFYPESGLHDSALSLTARNVPTGVVLDLHQFILVALYSADSMYLGTSPCEEGTMTPGGDPPSGRPCETGLIGQEPYSLDLSADFANTLTLQDVALLDVTGGAAEGASLRSLNGVSYPGQNTDVPAPAVPVLMIGGLGCIGVLRRRRLKESERTAIVSSDGCAG